MTLQSVSTATIWWLKKSPPLFEEFFLPKAWFFFLLNLHWNIYVRHQEHWTAKTITKHRLKCFDFFSGKYQNYTDTDWLKMFRELPNFFSKFVEYKFCFWKNCKILLEMIKLWKIHFPKKSLIYFPIQKVLINFSQRFIRCTNFKKKAELNVNFLFT